MLSYDQETNTCKRRNGNHPAKRGWGCMSLAVRSSMCLIDGAVFQRQPAVMGSSSRIQAPA